MTMHKPSIVRPLPKLIKADGLDAYVIVLSRKYGDDECTLEDVVLAKSLVDAYSKCTEIIDELNNLTNIANAFEITSITKQSII